tara:strand:+ start:205 stop:435 length:231 start_codon:yes stop_codon:yes gene_type:complete
MNENALRGLRRIPIAGGIIAIIVRFLIAFMRRNPLSAFSLDREYIEEVLLISVVIGLSVFVGLQILVWVIRGFLKK